MQTISGFTGSGLRPLICNFEDSAKAPFLSAARPYKRADNNPVAYLPQIKEGDYKNLMIYLERNLSSKFPEAFTDDHSQRALFQELCSISESWVKELAIRTSGSYRDSKAEEVLMGKLVKDLEEKRKLATNTPQQVTDSELPNREHLIKSASVNGRDFTTCKQQLDFTHSMRSLGRTSDQLRDLDYEVSASKEQLETELTENRARAATQDQGKEPTGRYQRFQDLLDGKTTLRVPGYGYEVKYMSPDFPSAGIAGAGGDISHDMEDIAVGCVRHGEVAKQWVPFRMTAVLDGHSSKNDNSAAQATLQHLPAAVISRLASHNKDELTKTGVVTALQAMTPDLDRKGEL